MSDRMAQEMLEAMEAINANAARLIGQISDDQWDAETPCSEWKVRDLVGHMVGTTRFLGASAARTEPPTPTDGDGLGDDALGAFKDAAADTMAAWNSPGAVDGDVVLPAEMPAIAALGVNLLDTGTHCWDLARAIGAEHGLTEAQIGIIDTWSRQVVNDEVRSGGGFGVNLDDGSAEGLRSTLAFLGRTD